jgi:hypothetical protein
MKKRMFKKILQKKEPLNKCWSQSWDICAVSFSNTWRWSCFYSSAWNLSYPWAYCWNKNKPFQGLE